ncbi:tubulin polyglutamylase ttll6-like [Culicoides brevitarsis]|uniref:tubulin polyglutamylase ttll6-like n=1 Tax=Culicoides brevitarsis TaxID=469753 RepID=UPI00307C7D25
MSSWFSELYLNKNRKSLSNDLDLNGNSFLNQNNNIVNNNTVKSMKNYSNIKASNRNNRQKKANNKNVDSKDSSGGDQESESSETEASSEESEDEEEDDEETGSDSTQSSSSSDESDEENLRKSKKPTNKFKECCQTGLLKVNNNTYSVIFNSKSEDNCKSYSIPKTKGLPYIKNKKRKDGQEKHFKKKKKYPLSICVLNSRYEIIGKVAKQLGYKLVKELDLWNVCWTDSIPPVEFCREMRRFQKINHFPGMYEISRKDMLARNMNRMLKLFPTDYQIFPKTWCFPADFGDAMSYSRRFKNKTFILKPDHSSQGKGIWLTKNLKEVDPGERLICQLYLCKPLLIDNFKFDLRVYTLITSLEPLRIFIYNEGLARFATTKYREPNAVNTSNVFMHLTNYSVNRHSRMFSHDYEAGSKRKFTQLNKILANEGHDIEALWANVDDVIVKTIISAWPMLKHNYNASFPNHDVVQACFELLGIDILIDHKLKPFILEVNHSPSFQTNQEIDREVKEALIRDTLLLLNIDNDVKKRVIDEDKKRVRTRLLQKIREHKDVQGDNAHKISKESSTNEPNEDGCKAWAMQIEWEETNLAGFRRVMPPPGDPNRYAKFFCAQNQVSVYSETAASKRREECAKKQRLEIEEKRKILRNQHCKGEGDDHTVGRNRKKLSLKQSQMAKSDGFAVENIPETEEKERISLLSQREFLIRSCGLIQMIYVSFHRNQLLSESDRRKYRDTFSKLTALETTMQNLPLLPLYKMQKKIQMKNVLIDDPSNVAVHETQGWPIRHQALPCLNVEQSTYKNNRTAMARYLTNSMKKSSIEARQFIGEKIKINNFENAYR